MTRSPEKSEFPDMRCEHLRISLLSEFLGDKRLQFFPDGRSFGFPEDQPWTDLIVNMDQVEFATEFPMVAFPGLFDLLKILVEFGSCLERCAVDTLELRIIRVPFVVSAGDRSEFECADVPGAHDVRSRAEVGELPIAIERDFF